MNGGERVLVFSSDNCGSCERAVPIAVDTAREMGLDVNVEKDPRKILDYEGWENVVQDGALPVPVICVVKGNMILRSSMGYREDMRSKLQQLFRQ